MWIINRRARDLIGSWLESIADEVCEQHCNALSQEHQISARIGQALERRWEKELSDANVLNHKITIITQDIPDKGRGALERSLGADLYIGVEIISEQGRVTKGLLVQAKWDGPLVDKERGDLRRQCQEMLARTDASYVWAYSEAGIRSRHAEDFTKKEVSMMSAPDGIGRLFSEVMACNRGDPALGLPDVEDTAQKRIALGAMLKELSVPHGMALTVRAPRGLGD